MPGVPGAALAQLAADVPAAVLASLLGMHVNTAISWARSLQQDWQPFVAEVRSATAKRQES